MQNSPSALHYAKKFFGYNSNFSKGSFVELSRSYDIAINNVKYFYLASALYVWVNMMSLHQLAIARPPIDPVWPILWAKDIPLVILADVAGVAAATFAVLAFWKPGVLAFRLIYAAAFLACASIPASLGAINHGDHEWFWLAFVFVFLPASRSRSGKLSYCLTFAAAQALILTFYTLAGFWKTLSGVRALINGVPGNFSPDALAWTLADRMAQTGTQPLLGPFFVDNPWLAWPMFLFLIYAQLFSIVIAFRPSLHLAWGFILIMFHTGTFLLMEIPFPTHIVILMLLLVASPFQRADWFRLQTLADLPIFGGLYSWLARRVHAPSSEAKSCVT